MHEERPSRLDGAVLWRNTTESSSTSRILPDGCMDLIWDGASLTVVGPDRQARLVHDRHGTVRHAIRFFPGQGPSVVGEPAANLVDRQVDVADLWGTARAREATERLGAAAEPRDELERLAITAAGLGDSSPVRDTPLPTAALASMAAAGLPVPAIASELGWSDRQLRRRCIEVVGYGPKHLGRILRLQRALRLARSGQPLVQVASDCGYADQGHLSRDVRTLTGVTPTDLLPGPIN